MKNIENTENMLFKITFALVIPLLLMGLYGFSSNEPMTNLKYKQEIAKLPTVTVEKISQNS